MKFKSWPLMHNNITREDLDELIDYLRKDDPKLTHGPSVKKFEDDWSEWLGVKYSVMVNSGSSANDLTILALREMFGTGEIIVPALTWVSDIASVIHAGFKPVFCDIRLDTLGLDPEHVLNSITSSTKAVFLTHVLGFSAITDELVSALRAAKVEIIEDVCESHGATHNNQKLGTFGLASNFSFYYAHHMTTIEGGVVCTNNDELFDVVRMMRSHGLLRESSFVQTKRNMQLKHPDLNPEFIFCYPAHNMRPTELNGILGISQLRRLDSNNLLRQRNFDYFIAGLDSTKYFTEFKMKGSCNYAFTIVLREPSFLNRDKVEEVLLLRSVEFRRGLSGGGNQLRQPYLERLAGRPTAKSLPVTDYVHHFAWYVGNHPELKLEDIDGLLEGLNSAF